MRPEQREQIKAMVAASGLGFKVTDEDIEHAEKMARAHVEQLKLLPLRRHVYLHHSAGPTTSLGMEALREVHQGAPKLFAHPESHDDDIPPPVPAH